MHWMTGERTMSKLLLSSRNILLACSASSGRGGEVYTKEIPMDVRASGCPLPPNVAIAKYFTHWGLERDQTNLSELLHPITV